MLVDDVLYRAAGIFGLDEDTRHDLGLAVALEMGGHHIPAGAQVHVFLFDADVGQRIGIEVPVAHELQPVGIRVDVHLVVVDRELVRPALHRVGLVTVEHDVLGHVVEIDPVGIFLLKHFQGVFLSQQFPLVQRALHPGHLPPEVGVIVRPDVGQGQQDDGQHEQHVAAVAHQEAAQAEEGQFAIAHS